MTKYQAGGTRRPYEIALLVVAVAAAGLNLRTAITSLPPLFPDLQTQLHLSSATLSLLAATPVICFGVVSAFTAWLKRRYGEEMILLVALVLLTARLTSGSKVELQHKKTLEEQECLSLIHI